MLAWLMRSHREVRFIAKSDGVVSCDPLEGLRPLMASIVTRALNSGPWVRRLVNSCGKGFCLWWEAQVGAVRPVSEVNDCLGPENFDPHRLKCNQG